MPGLTREQQFSFLGAAITYLGISQIIFPCSATSAHSLRLLGSFMMAFGLQLLKMNSAGILLGGLAVIGTVAADYAQKRAAGSATCCWGIALEGLLGAAMFTVGATAFCADKAKEGQTGVFPSSSSVSRASSVADASSAAASPAKKKAATKKSRSTSAKRK